MGRPSCGRKVLFSMKLILLALAILPGILITWFIYHKDKYQKEEPRNLILCFALGMAITLPVISLEKWAMGSGIGAGESTGRTLLASFLIIAFSEELVKFGVLTLVPYRKAYFDEPLDGIIYAVAIAMGFATLENLLYASRYGMETTILRAFSAVPAHASFAVIMGYFVGQSKFSERHRRYHLLLGLALPLIIHGTYNFLIQQEAWDGLILLAIPLLGLSVYFALRLIRRQQEESPFKPGEG